jgi:hypothetical protein
MLRNKTMLVKSEQQTQRITEKKLTKAKITSAMMITIGRF